jgi:hypothetical protein
MGAQLDELSPEVFNENVTDIHLFTNPFMKTALLSFQLSQHSNMAILIHAENQQEVRRILKPAGMPGGQRGFNKVFWDGSRADGIKVAAGRYHITLFENNEIKYRSHGFRLGG